MSKTAEMTCLESIPAIFCSFFRGWFFKMMLSKLCLKFFVFLGVGPKTFTIGAELEKFKIRGSLIQQIKLSCNHHKYGWFPFFPNIRHWNPINNSTILIVLLLLCWSPQACVCNVVFQFQLNYNRFKPMQVQGPLDIHVFYFSFLWFRLHTVSTYESKCIRFCIL